MSIENFTRVSYETHEKWLAGRQDPPGLGGSDAAAVMGKSRFKSIDEVYDEKMGIRKQKDISDKPYVKFGTEAEKHLIALFALDFPGIKVTHYPFDILTSAKYPRMKASLDSELVDASGMRGFLEIKCPNIRSKADYADWKNGWPIYYHIQLMHYFAVTGWDFCYLKARLKWEAYGEREMMIMPKLYRLDRADYEQDIQAVINAEKRFWDYVDKGMRPPKKISLVA